MSNSGDRFENIFSDPNEIHDYVAEEGIQRLLATNTPLSLQDKIEALYSLSYKMVKIPSKKAEEMIPCCYRCSFLHALKQKIDDRMNRILEQKEINRLEQKQRNRELDEKYRKRYFGETSGVNQNKNTQNTPQEKEKYSSSSNDSEDSE